jgi:transposase InsO family protein
LNLAKDVVPTRPDDLEFADVPYIAIAMGFVYLAAIPDAWSRRVVGCALGRRSMRGSRRAGDPQDMVLSRAR